MTCSPRTRRPRRVGDHPAACTPTRAALFFEWFTDSEFTAFAGHRLDLRQANCSVSAAGVLRGLHFAQLPPSQAKYVTCLRGVGVRRGRRHPGRLTDIRAVGFGAARRPRPPVGLHLRGSGARFPCAARRFDGDVPVLGGLRPDREHTIRATDPALDIDWPSGRRRPILSDRDAEAPTLDEVQAAGLLPTWDDAGVRRRAASTQRRPNRRLANPLNITRISKYLATRFAEGHAHDHTDSAFHRRPAHGRPVHAHRRRDEPQHRRGAGEGADGHRRPTSTPPSPSPSRRRRSGPPGTRSAAPA